MDRIKELEAELQSKEKELAEVKEVTERLRIEDVEKYSELEKLKEELPDLLVDAALGRVDVETKDKIKQRIKTLDEECEESATTQGLLREKASALYKVVLSLPGEIRAAKQMYKK